MPFLIGSALAAAAVTALAAWLLVTYRSASSATAQTIGAALSFPALAILLFVVATLVALAGADGRPGNDPGMPIFAMAFFLFYALFIGAAIGIPTAIVAVRAFRP
jgi:hypothetical protein